MRRDQGVTSELTVFLSAAVSYLCRLLPGQGQRSAAVERRSRWFGLRVPVSLDRAVLWSTAAKVVPLADVSAPGTAR